MIIDNCIVITPENAVEVIAANDAILKIRERKEKEREREKCKLAIAVEISNVISKLGVAETKTIVRGLLKDIDRLYSKD